MDKKKIVIAIAAVLGLGAVALIWSSHEAATAAAASQDSSLADDESDFPSLLYDTAGGNDADSDDLTQLLAALQSGSATSAGTTASTDTSTGDTDDASATTSDAAIQAALTSALAQVGSATQTAENSSALSTLGTLVTSLGTENATGFTGTVSQDQSGDTSLTGNLTYASNATPANSTPTAETPSGDYALGGDTLSLYGVASGLAATFAGMGITDPNTIVSDYESGNVPGGSSGSVADESAIVTAQATPYTNASDLLKAVQQALPTYAKAA